MKEPKKIISENELPIAAPSADLAWDEMRKLLDEDRPEAAPLLPLHKPGFGSIMKYLTGAAFLLLIISLAYFFNSTSKDNKTLNTKIVDAPVEPGSMPIDSGLNTPQSKAEGLGSDLNSELSPDKVAGKNEKVDIPKGAGTLLQSRNTGRNITLKKSNSDGRKDIIQSGQHQMPPEVSLIKKEEIADEKKPGNATSDVVESLSSASSGTADAASDKKSSDAKLKMASSDSTATPAEEPAPHIELPAEKWTINTGLQWTIPVPSLNGSNYFAGPNGQSQPYRLLLPGAWVQAEKEKQLITLDLNPFAVSLPPAKVFRTVTSVENQQDTLVQTIDQRTLVKTFGLSAGVAYQYKVFSNWWAGAGVQMLFWKRAVARSSSAINKTPMGGTAGVTTNQQSIYKVTDEWSYFSKIQASISAELFYKAPKWQAGFRLGLPITPLAQQDGPKYFLRGELIYRLHLTGIHLDK